MTHGNNHHHNPTPNLGSILRAHPGPLKARVLAGLHLCPSLGLTSINALGMRLGTNPALVHGYLDGTRNGPAALDILGRVATLLGVSVADLRGEEPAPVVEGASDAAGQAGCSALNS